MGDGCCGSRRRRQETRRDGARKAKPCRRQDSQGAFKGGDSSPQFSAREPSPGLLRRLCAPRTRGGTLRWRGGGSRPPLTASPPAARGRSLPRRPASNPPPPSCRAPSRRRAASAGAAPRRSLWPLPVAGPLFTSGSPAPRCMGRGGGRPPPAAMADPAEEDELPVPGEWVPVPRMGRSRGPGGGASSPRRWGRGGHHRRPNGRLPAPACGRGPWSLRSALRGRSGLPPAGECRCPGARRRAAGPPSSGVWGEIRALTSEIRRRQLCCRHRRGAALSRQGLGGGFVFFQLINEFWSVV